ncbi:flippase [Clostridium beijerinckii]|uniref:flippase n=1 Tax=Clostridium beijerinckii TaxID=1520 RepID=UPI0002F9B7BC|nr:flippase [Clostridium beijerinckii]
MKVKSIKANAILNIIYTIVNMLFPIITFPYVSRILLADGMGKVSFFTSISNYAVMMASLGISTYGIREVAKVRDDRKELSKVATELLIINTVLTIAVLCVLAISVNFIEKFKVEPVLFIINAIIIITAPMGLNWLYSGLEQYAYITKRTIAFKTISLVLVFILVREQNDYPIYVGITAFSTIGAYICNFVYSRKFVEFHLYKDIVFKRHYRPMLLLFASILAVSVYTNLDTIMLGFIRGDTEVGLYTAAVKVKWLLLTAVNAISAVLLPRLSFYLSQSNVKEYNRILKKSVSIIFVISIPMSLYFIAEAQDSILLLGGSNYLDAIPCMQIVMPILLISGFSNITGNQVLIPYGKDSAFMTAVVTGAVMNVVFNVILMPKFGCTGAAIATLLAEVTQMCIQFFYSKEHIIKNIRLKTLLKVVIAASVAFVVMRLFRGYININAFVNLVITAMLYFGIYGVLILVFREESAWEILNEVLVKMRMGKS